MGVPSQAQCFTTRDIDMTPFTRSLATAAVPAGVFGAPARAQEVTAGDLVITQAWTRATPGGAKIGGGYLTIENKGSASDRLIGGSAGIARQGGGSAKAT